MIKNYTKGIGLVEILIVTAVLGVGFLAVISFLIYIYLFFTHNWVKYGVIYFTQITEREIYKIIIVSIIQNVRPKIMQNDQSFVIYLKGIGQFNNKLISKQTL